MHGLYFGNIQNPIVLIKKMILTFQSYQHNPGMVGNLLDTPTHGILWKVMQGLSQRWLEQETVSKKVLSGTGRISPNPPANAIDTGDVDSFPSLGRFPGGGNDNPFPYSFLENSMERGAWWATVHGVAKSQTQLTTCGHEETKTRNTKLGFQD